MLRYIHQKYFGVCFMKERICGCFKYYKKGELPEGVKPDCLVCNHYVIVDGKAMCVRDPDKIRKRKEQEQFVIIINGKLLYNSNN